MKCDVVLETNESKGKIKGLAPSTKKHSFSSGDVPAIKGGEIRNGAKNKDLTFWVWAKLKFHGMLENIECGIEWIFFLYP